MAQNRSCDSDSTPSDSIRQLPPQERDVVVQAAEAMPDLPAWNTRAAAMTPLVRAYDQRIEELGQLNKIQVQAFECVGRFNLASLLIRFMTAHARTKHAQAEKLGALAGRVESLVNENEGLLEELQALKEQKGVADGNEDGDGGLLVQMLKAENAALQEEAEAVGGEMWRFFIVRPCYTSLTWPPTCKQAAHEVGRAREAAAVKEQQCHQLLHDLRYVPHQMLGVGSSL